MTITSQDIQQQGFEHAVRGYNMGQVDDFLDLMAREVDELNNEIARLRTEASKTAPLPVVGVSQEEYDAAVARADAFEAELADLKLAQDDAPAVDDTALQEAQARIAELEAELKENQIDQSAISKAFISAQRSADALKEEARAEGERIYREAEGKAREFLREALTEKQRILDEAHALQESCESFRLQYLEMIEHFSIEANRNFAAISSPVVDEADIDHHMPVEKEDVPATETFVPQVQTETQAAVEPAEQRTSVPVHNEVAKSVFDNTIDDIEDIIEID